MALQRLNVTLKLPFIEIGGEWAPNDAERRASWEMYVELVTRVSVAELKPDEGELREVLDSLYSLFASTREILRRYGPDVAKPGERGTLSFGFIAVAVLNGVLRPLLSTWHRRLTSYEATRAPSVGIVEHEIAWSDAPELRAALNTARTALTAYAELLAEVTGTPSLVTAGAGGGTG